MDATPTLDEDLPPLYQVTPEELAASEERMLHECGFTREELEAQARRGRFETETAKRAWFALY